MATPSRRRSSRGSPRRGSDSVSRSGSGDGGGGGGSSPESGEDDERGCAGGVGGVLTDAAGLSDPARAAALVAVLKRLNAGCGGSDLRGVRPVPVGSTSQCIPVGIPVRSAALSSMHRMWRSVSHPVIPSASILAFAAARSAILRGELSEVPSNAKVCPVTSPRLAHSWSPSFSQRRSAITFARWVGGSRPPHGNPEDHMWKCPR